MDSSSSQPPQQSGEANNKRSSGYSKSRWNSQTQVKALSSKPGGKVVNQPESRGGFRLSLAVYPALMAFVGMMFFLTKVEVQPQTTTIMRKQEAVSAAKPVCTLPTVDSPAARRARSAKPQDESKSSKFIILAAAKYEANLRAAAPKVPYTPMNPDILKQYGVGPNAFEQTTQSVIPASVSVPAVGGGATSPPNLASPTANQTTQAGANQNLSGSTPAAPMGSNTPPGRRMPTPGSAPTSGSTPASGSVPSYGSAVRQAVQRRPVYAPAGSAQQIHPTVMRQAAEPPASGITQQGADETPSSNTETEDQPNSHIRNY